MKKMKIHN